MSREIEYDGFITRAEDLKGTPRNPIVVGEHIDFEARGYGNELHKLIPPPFGSVIITENGLVLMCKGTYKMLSEGKEYTEVDYESGLDRD